MSYFADKRYAKPFYNAIRKYIGKHHNKAIFSFEKDAFFKINTGGKTLLLPNMNYSRYTDVMYDWAYKSIVNMLISGTDIPHPYYEQSKEFTHLYFVNELCKEIQECLEDLDYEIKDHNQFKCDVLYFLYRISK
jgi:hypothetical protein